MLSLVTPASGAFLRRVALLLCVLAFITVCSLNTNGQAPTPTSDPAVVPARAANDSADLAKQLANPIASLISLPFQSNFDRNMGPKDDGWRYTLNVQPVIPFKLNDKWNVVSRTIVPIIHQSKVAGDGDQNGLGDTLQSLFFTPNKTEPFIWGIGPAVLVPTATHGALGSKKLGLGPTGVILKQKREWTYLLLVNHIWSVAGSGSRAPISSTFLQPTISYTTKSAWTYNLNTESSYDWKSRQWSVPVHFTVSKLLRFGKQPVSVGGSLRCWAASPADGPQGCGARLIVTPLFPR